MSRKIVNMQIRVTEDVRDRAKTYAKSEGITLSELILTLLAGAGDSKLKALANKELNERPKPGRRWNKPEA